MQQTRQADKTSFEWLIQQNKPLHIHHQLSDNRHITFSLKNNTIFIELIEYLYEQYKTQKHQHTLTNQNMPEELKIVYQNVEVLFNKCFSKKQAFQVPGSKIRIKCPVFGQDNQIIRQISVYLEKVPEQSRQEEMKKIIDTLLQQSRQKNIIASFQQQIPLQLLNQQGHNTQNDSQSSLNASYQYQNQSKYANVLSFVTRMLVTGMLVSSIMFSVVPFLIQKHQSHPYFIYLLCLVYCAFVMFLIILFYISLSDKLKIGVLSIIGLTLIAIYAINIKRLTNDEIRYVKVSTILAILFSWALMSLERIVQYTVKRIHGNIRKSKNKMMVKLSQSLQYGKDENNKKNQ